MATVLADRFVLQTEIARGAVGVVWRGHDQASGEPVAVKVLRDELRGEVDIVEGFFSEAEILAAVDHPGVIGVRDFVVTDAVLAIVLELAEGTDLREHLSLHGPLPAAEAALRCADAAETLAAVQRAGFLHGDVKPGNLMLVGDGVKLVDFGVARAAGSTSTPSHGTPEYTAPEIAAGESACPGIDNYALGLVLYEALTGHSAYRGGSITDVLERHLAQIPVKPAAVDADLWTVVETLLALDPRGRGDLDAVAVELRRLAPGLSRQATAPIEPELRDRGATAPITSAPATPPLPQIAAAAVREGARPSKRWPRALVGAGAVGLAAVAACVLFALPGIGGGDGTDVADPSSTTAPAKTSDSPEPTDGPADPPEEPTVDPTTPGLDEPEADSDTPAIETDDLSDSDENDSAPEDSNEGEHVDQMPGSDLIGSRMPGN
ncbi:protein kinase [Glycomyces sp. L485]|uniref:serine/threonine-protein kinase n=1 Tax=Glycomyces sp. L485 TaxID=2909235 RepID=UPI001F4A144C|nr:serine/threonine-protein kinase [Glycomyces sp. L485]MCH7231277.1 protein kinase [Glycomyces sp. L485]